ncbi:MAG: DUF350 domain-containing protein [Deltaproteobacteria bacterium]|nr:DUF350 domain-containing protein [Deltaproteobacteria bacterium]
MDFAWHYLRPITILSSVIYALLGLALFAVALLVITKVTPFSIRKEIEEDQNVALAIIIGSIFIALAIIIQAAIT